jgi:hypothetical protein
MKPQPYKAGVFSLPEWWPSYSEFPVRSGFTNAADLN